MTKQEFFAALRRALSGLPLEERDNVLKYYEDYFLDAEGESEEEIIHGLGDPQKIADDILREYRELQPHASANRTAPRRWKGVSPWLLLVLVLLAIPVGIPVLATLLGIVLSVLARAAAVLVGRLCVPLVLLAAGAALIVFSFALWGAPASAVLTLGGGFILLALGGLTGLLLAKLCMLFVPPLFRGLIALLRWPFKKLKEVLR